MATHTFAAVRIRRSGSFQLPGAPSTVFSAFSPEGERAWARGWEPEYLFPPDGHPTPGLVFRTAAGGEPTLWLLLQFDITKFAAQYVRVVWDSRIALVTVQCSPAGSNTEVRVTYEQTGLSASGNQKLGALTEVAFALMLEEWRVSITRVLTT